MNAHTIQLFDKIMEQSMTHLAELPVFLIMHYILNVLIRKGNSCFLQELLRCYWLYLLITSKLIHH
jgi:hypothetical protein